MTSVLFVRLSAMGDLVQGLGAVRALHRVRPTWRLTFVTQGTFAPLLDGVDGLARIVSFDRRGGWRGLRSLRRDLQRDRYDVALDLQGNWKSTVVAWLSRARRRIGMAGPLRQEPASRLMLDETVATTAAPHPARIAWELVHRLAPDAPFLRPRLSCTPVELARERDALAGLGVDWRRPFVLLVVADARDPRSLRPDRVRSESRNSAVPVVHLIGPGEPAGTGFDGAVTLRHAAGEPRRLIALGRTVAEAGGGVLGPDRGATHVLAAAGAPCRVWFGSQAPTLTAPPDAEAMVHPSPPACSPCRSRRCAHPEGPVCMDFGTETARVVDVGLPREGHVRGREPGR